MSFASNTPIHFLPGVGPRTAAIFHELGVHTAGQLHNIPEKMLVELFGPSIRAVTGMMRVHEPQHQKRPLMKRLQLAMQVMTML